MTRDPKPTPITTTLRRALWVVTGFLLAMASVPPVSAAAKLVPATLTVYLRAPESTCSYDQRFLSLEDGADPGDRSCMPGYGGVSGEVTQVTGATGGLVWAPRGWAPVVIDGTRRVRATLAVGSSECACATNGFGIGKARFTATITGQSGDRVFEMLYGDTEYMVMPGEAPRVFVFEGPTLSAFDRQSLTTVSIRANPRGASIQHGRIELDTPASKIEIPILVPDT